MLDKHTSIKEGVHCPNAGDMVLENWQGIGWVYDCGLIPYQVVKDGKCPECHGPIGHLLSSRETENEKLALDLLSEEEGC